MVPVGNSNSSTVSSSTPNSISLAKYYASIIDNKYEVPADLLPGVKGLLIGFLIGDMDQIDSSHLSDLLNESKLVFTSIQSLKDVKEIVTKYDQKPLHQRETRFSEQSSSSSQCQP